MPIVRNDVKVENEVCYIPYSSTISSYQYEIPNDAYDTIYLRTVVGDPIAVPSFDSFYVNSGTYRLSYITTIQGYSTANRDTTVKTQITINDSAVNTDEQTIGFIFPDGKAVVPTIIEHDITIVTDNSKVNILIGGFTPLGASITSMQITIGGIRLEKLS